MAGDVVEERIILVIGACGLDRLLTVSSYPIADSKIRTTHYKENGGGNAANTAHAIALLSNASIFCNFANNETSTTTSKGKNKKTSKKSVKTIVKFLSKVGNDAIGIKLIQELDCAGVDLTSPLFMLGDKHSTSSTTTIIVTESDDPPTRTCLHTPGTCGELSVDDIKDSNIDMDTIFEGNVVLVHSDSRHTDVALLIAKEANIRNIPVSVDVEKDRNSEALDKLIEEADIIFTNSDQMDLYLERLNNEKGKKYNQKELQPPSNVIVRCDPSRISDVKESYIHFLSKSIQPSTYFTRWYQQTGKQIIITKGNHGAVRVVTKSATSLPSQPIDKNVVGSSIYDQTIIEQTNTDNDQHEIEISIQNSYFAHVQQKFTCRSTTQAASLSSDDEVTGNQNTDDNSKTINNQQQVAHKYTASYHVHTVGVLEDLKIVDTTGAGDAFIGAYLIASICKDHNSLNFTINECLQFASWVAGRKIQGYGARTTLPTGHDVDAILGNDITQVKEYLAHSIGKFHL